MKHIICIVYVMDLCFPWIIIVLSIMLIIVVNNRRRCTQHKDCAMLSYMYFGLHNGVYMVIETTDHICKLGDR